MKPVVFGEVLFDRFPDGQRVLGGAPFNVAWHLQALGDAPLFISRVGADAPGDSIVAAMAQWGMDLAALQRDPQHVTGEVVVEVEAGEPHYDIRPDVAYDFIDAKEFPRLAAPALIYHGTLALRNPVSRGALEVLLDREGVSVFLDVNLRPPWWNDTLVRDCLLRARWAKLNEHELTQLVGSSESAVAQAQALCDEYALELLLVTHGARGAVAYGSHGELARVAPDAQTRVVDTVGAGDAFTAVFVHGLLNHWSLPHSMEIAQRFASAVVGIRGAVPTQGGFYQSYLAL